MNLTFTKGLGRDSEYYIYTVYDGNDETGRFVYLRKNDPSGYFSIFPASILKGIYNLIFAPKNAYPFTFVYDEKEYKIGVDGNVLLGRYKIKEANATNFIAKYTLSDCLIGSGLQGKLVIGTDIYGFTDISENSLFKKSTWWQWKYKLSNGVDSVIYSFESNRYRWPMGPYMSTEIAFDGIIETTGNNKFLIFAGIFLIEQNLL